MSTPEGIIKKDILRWLHWHKIFIWDNPNMGTYNEKRGCYLAPRTIFRMKGVADIIGCLPGGQFLAIEVKSKVGRLSPDQKIFLKTVNDLGGKAFMARSVEDVEFNLICEIQRMKDKKLNDSNK